MQQSLDRGHASVATTGVPLRAAIRLWNRWPLSQVETHW